MIKKETEICVVGGGPGGVFLSAYLSKHNIPHVLVEAKSFPRSKPCADTISLHVINRIKQLLPEAYKKLKSGLIKQHVKGVRFCPPNNKSFNYWYLDLPHYNGEPSSFIIKREIFDDVLLKEVAQLPFSEVIQPCRIEKIDFGQDNVTVHGKEIEITCKAVLVASGGTSLLASNFTGNKTEKNHYAYGLRAYYKNVAVHDDELSEFYLNKDSFIGAFYISSLGDNLYNVNMVMNKGSVEERKLGFRQIFSKFIEEHPVLKEKFKNAELQGEIEGHPLLLGTKRRKVSHKRALFVGDAAGIINFVNANGIPQAMKSAEIAVETYLKAKGNEGRFEEIFGQYDRTLYKRLRADLATSKMAGWFIGKPIFLAIIFTSMRLFFNAYFANVALDFALYGRSPIKRIKGNLKRKKD